MPSPLPPSRYIPPERATLTATVGAAVYRRTSTPSGRGYERGELVTAHAAYDPEPDDPVEILRVLPAEYHQQFLAEYEAAVDGARRPEQFRLLHDVLRLWRLRAIAYSDPGYSDRMNSARHGAGFSPAEQVIPGWPRR